MLTVERISKNFENQKILENMTFHVGNNEIIGLLGPNGAGKTTLMKIICGIITPDSGEIILDDNPVRQKDINVAFEGDRHLYWPLSCLENIYYFSALKGVFKREVDHDLKEQKKFPVITPYLNKKYGDLSLGQKQIVSIVTALITQPKVLILDEPSNGLDVYYIDELVQLILNYKAQTGNSILVSSHDLDFLTKIVDRYIIINHGKKIKELRKEDISKGELQQLYKNVLEIENE